MFCAGMGTSVGLSEVQLQYCVCDMVACCYLQVCAYHSSYYRPDNLCLIVAGQVEPEQLFRALTPVEEKILSKVSRKWLYKQTREK